MPQLVKKRRSGWAVLAAGALVASILAVGATPVAATERSPDQQAIWKACLGPAMADQGFTDVSMDSVHYDNINCLAYYGITTGRTAESFAPDANVTRSQMALFLARAADAAGIDLGESTDQGFTDLNADDTERVDAINRVVGAGIMFGDTETSFDPPSTTVFAPTDQVTRWEMAMFLFAFLDHALTSVLIDTLPASIDDDGTGQVELGSLDGESGNAPDDYFRDSRRQTPAHVDDRISAIYELGITTGQNNMVGEQGVYNPNGLVTRAQMASFIMRAVGHTNLRPAGLTAQSTSSDTMVSVRDADFVPIGNVRTEVFTTNFPDDAFNADGECIGRFTTNQDPSFDECAIDVGDVETDGDTGNALWEGVGIKQGNPLEIDCGATGTTHATYRFMAGTRGSETDFTVYAWSSSLSDSVDDDSDLFQSVSANTLVTTSEAVKAVITGGSRVHTPMGGTVTYTVQLRDAKGNDVGPTPGANNYFNVQVDTYQEGRDGGGALNNEFTGDDFTRIRSVREPDSSGSFTVTVSYRDTTRVINNADAEIQVTIDRATGNELYVVDMTTPAATARPDQAADEAVTGIQGARVRFSDDASTPTSIDAGAAVWRLLSSRNRNSVTVTVKDQYGATYRRGTHAVRAADSESAADFPTNDADTDSADESAFAVSSAGRRSIGYTHVGEDPVQQTVTLTLVGGARNDQNGALTAVEIDGDAVTDEVSVFWADRGDENSGAAQPILLGDPGANQILIDSDGTAGNPFVPHAYGYGSDDKFVVEGEVVTIDQFEEILAAYNSDPTSGALIASLGTLSWVGFDYNRPNDGATWTIDDLSCRAPAGDGD